MFWMFAKNTSRGFAPKGEFGYPKNLAFGEIEKLQLICFAMCVNSEV